MGYSKKRIALNPSQLLVNAGLQAWHSAYRGRFLPDSKDDLKEGANPRDKEDGADQVTLGQSVMLQAQPFGKDERDGHESSQGSQVVLRNQEKRWFRGRDLLLQCKGVSIGTTRNSKPDHTNEV